MTTKHGLTRFTQAPTEGKHMSAMLISIIPSMLGGYTKIVMPSPIVTLLKNCRTDEKPGEGMHNSNRLRGHMKLNNTIFFSNVGYV